MRYRLLDILACPMCKYFPLEYVVFSERVNPEVKYPGELGKPHCEVYCGLYRKYIVPENVRRRVIELRDQGLSYSEVAKKVTEETGYYLSEEIAQIVERIIREGKESEMFHPNPSELPCEECIKREIVEGILYCPNCLRWYPIREEIPEMLPDDLRSLDEDYEFLMRYRDKVPEIILQQGKPVNITYKK